MINQLLNVILCYSTTLETVNEQYRIRICYSDSTIIMGRGIYNWRKYILAHLRSLHYRTIYSNGIDRTEFMISHNY